MPQFACCNNYCALASYEAIIDKRTISMQSLLIVGDPKWLSNNEIYFKYTTDTAAQQFELHKSIYENIVKMLYVVNKMNKVATTYVLQQEIVE